MISYIVRVDMTISKPYIETRILILIKFRVHILKLSKYNLNLLPQNDTWLFYADLCTHINMIHTNLNSKPQVYTLEF
jgi:hypothetical protein